MYKLQRLLEVIKTQWKVSGSGLQFDFLVCFSCSVSHVLSLYIWLLNSSFHASTGIGSVTGDIAWKTFQLRLLDLHFLAFVCNTKRDSSLYLNFHELDKMQNQNYVKSNIIPLLVCEIR